MLVYVGVTDGVRTRDIAITRRAFYQLNYRHHKRGQTAICPLCRLSGYLPAYVFLLHGHLIPINLIL